MFLTQVLWEGVERSRIKIRKKQVGGRKVDGVPLLSLVRTFGNEFGAAFTILSALAEWLRHKDAPAKRIDFGDLYLKV